MPHLDVLRVFIFRPAFVSTVGGVDQTARRPSNLRVEVLDVYPTTLGHCPHFNLVSCEMSTAGAEFCELSSQVMEYPDSVIKSHDRAVAIMNFLKKTLDGVPANVSLDMVDLLTFSGFLKGLRHGVMSSFAVLMNGRKVCEREINWQKIRDEATALCLAKP